MLSWYSTVEKSKGLYNFLNSSNMMGWVRKPIWYYYHFYLGHKGLSLRYCEHPCISSTKAVKNNEAVGHLPCEYSQILWYFIAHGRKINVEVTGSRHHSKQLCGKMGRMGIPCMFSCLSKAQINLLKELLESKIRL